MKYCPTCRVGGFDPDGESPPYTVVHVYHENKDWPATHLHPVTREVVYTNENL